MMHRPPDLDSLLNQISRGGPYVSLDDVNRAAAERMREYNTRPQPDLGGLSPDEMQQLLSGDWESSGALRVRDDLTIAEAGEVPFLADARTLLEFVANAGAVKETPAKNLPRAVVAELLPRLRMPARYRSLVNDEPPPKNEQDVRWLPDLRFTMLVAGLLVRRNGLRISHIGRELSADENAGALYALLFGTFFRRVDLRAFGRFADHAGLQQTIAFSFYRLRTVAREWTSPETLSESAWLASAKDPPTPMEMSYGDMSHHAFRQRRPRAARAVRAHGGTSRRRPRPVHRAGRGPRHAVVRAGAVVSIREFAVGGRGPAKKRVAPSLGVGLTPHGEAGRAWLSARRPLTAVRARDPSPTEVRARNRHSCQ